MMNAIAVVALAYTTPAMRMQPFSTARVSTALMKAAAKGETVKDLEALADQLNPNVGFWDPLGMVNINLYDKGQEATIGWLRHAEIKHGRVAMAAFVGYCFQANGIVFPWALTGGPLAEFTAGLSGKEVEATTMFSDIAAAGFPNEQWDAVPTAGKLQILGTIFLLEWVGEMQVPHYTKGGKPGYYPPLKESELIPHPVPFNLYDPFDLFGDMDEATKQRRLLMEINNGRLAMIGIFGFLCAAKGLDVPFLNGVIPFYDGETMAAFGSGDAGLPLVQKMIDFGSALKLDAIAFR